MGPPVSEEEAPLSPKKIVQAVIGGQCIGYSKSEGRFVCSDRVISRKDHGGDLQKRDSEHPSTLSWNVKGLTDEKLQSIFFYMRMYNMNLVHLLAFEAAAFRSQLNQV